MRRQAATLAWRALALACVALGAVGALLPVLPTVPFLLVAAWAGNRGWPGLEARLLAHPTYGPSIRAWRERGQVSRRAKLAASTMMAASTALLWASGAPGWVKVAVPVFLLGVATWLWRRPEA
jgi:uncharacterized membrane protein YbaN (DUF454 family)